MSGLRKLFGRLPGSRSQPPPVISGPTNVTRMSSVIFTSTNLVGTDMRYSKGNPTSYSAKTQAENIGTCASLSTLWLANMLTTVAPAATKPNQGQAAMMFAKNWITKQGEARTYANIADAGLTCTGSWDYDSLTRLMGDLLNLPGYYLVEVNYAHFVGVVVRGGDYFLYDSNIACWKFSANAFVAQSVQFLVAQGWPDVCPLSVYQVTLE